MNLYKTFIAASSHIVDIRTRSRAELFTYLLIGRQVAIATLILTLYFVHPREFAQVIPIFILNFIAYLFSRSRFFGLGAAIIFIEPMVAVPLVMAKHLEGMAFGAPVWLGPAPIISSLILPARYTIAVILGTLVSFGFIFWQISGVGFQQVITEFIYILFSSILALVGSFVIEKSETVLQAERAKVMQSSKLASLGEMAGGVAHELNSPLGAIVLSVEMIEEMLMDPNSSKQSILESVKNINNIADRMTKIINGLKTFARDTRNEKTLFRPAVSWVTDSLNLCQRRFENKGVIVTMVPAGLETVCSVQRIQLSQVLLNLLNNSFDAIQDMKEKWIRIEAQVSLEFLDVLVTDSGHGLEKNVVDRLFEPFFTTKDYGKGTGLGLSVSKGIMENHGGDLIYDSSCKNTRFIIRLPLSRNKQEAA